MKTFSAEEIEKLPYRPCVGIMLYNKEGKVFVGQRLDNSQNAWQMPQGGIEKGENPKDAVLRELEEETGIPANTVDIIAQSDGWIPYDLPHRLIPNLWNGKYRGQKQRWFLLQFNGNDDLININTEIPEFSDWCWMSVENLLECIVPFKRDVYEQVLLEFKDKINLN